MFRLLQLHLPQKISNIAAQGNEEEVQENNSNRHDSVTAAVSNAQTTSQALSEVENRRHFQAESQSTASHLFARTRSFHSPTFIRPGTICRRVRTYVRLVNHVTTKRKEVDHIL